MELAPYLESIFAARAEESTPSGKDIFDDTSIASRDGLLTGLPWSGQCLGFALEIPAV
jgi:hypothetical protein